MGTELYSQIALITIIISVLMIVLTSKGTCLKEDLQLTILAILAGIAWPMLILCIIIAFFAKISGRT